MSAEEYTDAGVAALAAAIGEPARTRMLYCLMEGHARTSTELAMVSGVTPSTASVHLNKLREQNLVRVIVQGRHRYYSLSGPAVARTLEGLSVLAGARRSGFVPSTPVPLRAARTCYDHMAGALAVSLHDRLVASCWIHAAHRGDSYELTREGERSLAALGVDIEPLRAGRRRFAYACLDWSERRPHLGGALGAALLALALRRKWVAQELDSRALHVTRSGRREFHSRFGVEA